MYGLCNESVRSGQCSKTRTTILVFGQFVNDFGKHGEEKHCSWHVKITGYNRKPPGKQIGGKGFELYQASMDTSAQIVDMTM